MGPGRVVITGGRGRLARVLAPLLQEAGWLVDALGVEQLDVTDRAAVRRMVETVRPRAVVNLAAMTSIDRCERLPAEARAVNVTGVGHLSDACCRVSAHLLHVSSDYVFAGDSDVPYRETDAAEPLSVYGLTKLQGEAAAGVGATVVRTAWVSSGFAPSLVQSVLGQAAESTADLRYIADQVGSPTSAFDLSATLVRLLADPHPGLFHVTNEGSATWFELARFVLEEAGHDPDRVVPIDTADFGPSALARRPRYSVLDNAALRDAGFPPMADWRTAFARLIRPLAALDRV